MSPRALGTGLAIAIATLLLAPPAGATSQGANASVRERSRPPARPAQAFGSYDNTYEVPAGGTVTDTLGALGADDLLVYDTLTVGELAPASAGTLTVSGTFPSGTFTFTAAARFSGTASATYVGETADGEQLTASVVFEVQPAAPVNRPPVARADSATLTAGSTVTVNPLANDTDPDEGDLLTLSAVTPAAVDGVRVAMAGTSIRVRADVGAAAGTRRFRYTVTDRAGATATGVLTVTVRTRPVPSTTTTRPTPPPSTPTSTVNPSSGTTGDPPQPTPTRPGGGAGSTPTPGGTVDRNAPGATTTTSFPGTTGSPSTIALDGSDAGSGNGSAGTGAGTPVADGVGGDLPTTGSNAGSPVLAGIVLLGLGLGFVALAGRRRLHRTD
jgi:LPXTG-motif cell wall-anchored protein